ncbi:MAG: S9 family peptidase, partial [Firmicutes bacterium]|nr:S9 family peptidase [Bacillota bacterium]
IVEPNVRGSSGYGKTYCHLDDVEKRLDSVKDIKALDDHLIEQGIADRDRIAVMGTSYGGFMTLNCAARYPELWCCCVATVGMFNLVTFLENTSPFRRSNREQEYGSLEKHRDILYNVSPAAKVDDIVGPLLIIHGKNDPRVPVTEAYQAMEYLKKKGVDAEMMIYDDEGHGVAKFKNKLDCYPRVLKFVERCMKL